MRSGLISILLLWSFVSFGQGVIFGHAAHPVTPSPLTEYGWESHYDYENNTNDDAGNHNLTATGGATYATDNSPPLNTYAGDLNGSNRSFDIPQFDWGNEWTFCTRWEVFSGTGTRTIATNMVALDGWKLQYDFTSERYEFVTGNGSLTDEAYSNSSLGVGVGDPSICVVCDKSLGSVLFYSNGVNVTSDGVTRTDYETNAMVQIGLNIDDSGDLYGDVDDTPIYLGKLDSDSILYWHNNVGEEVHYLK